MFFLQQVILDVSVADTGRRDGLATCPIVSIVGKYTHLPLGGSTAISPGGSTSEDKNMLFMKM